MVREGYTADANTDVIALRGVGARCAEIDAASHARPAARSAVRAFQFSLAAVDTFPAPLAVTFSRDDSVRAWNAEYEGRSWHAVARDATSTLVPAEGGGAELRVDDAVAWNRVRIVGRGDFDHDGSDDLLIETQGGAQHGSLVAFGVHVVTRDHPGERLRYVRRIW